MQTSVGSGSSGCISRTPDPDEAEGSIPFPTPFSLYLALADGCFSNLVYCSALYYSSHNYYIMSSVW